MPGRRVDRDADRKAGTMPPLSDAGTCARCGYPLRGLARPVCPECGLEFHPDVAGTFQYGPRPSRARPVVARIAFALLVGAFLLAIAYAHGGAPHVCAGPLALLGTQSPGERAVGVIMALVLGGFFLAPFVYTRPATIAGSLASLLLWLAVGTLIRMIDSS